MSKTKACLLAGLLAIAAALPVSAAEFALDKAHTSIGFAVRHMMVSKTRGTFDEFEGRFAFDPDSTASWFVEATIQTRSINTANADRDDHLRGPDFFDVENYPTIGFTSTGVSMTSETKGTLRGELTMRGVTKPIELELEVLGMITDPWGNTRAGFTARGVIDREDWGLTWNKALEAGGLVVGNEVELTLEVEGILAQ